MQVFRTDRGSATVEAALVLIPFLSMMFGLVYAGLLILAWNNAAFAAAQAARYASVHGASSGNACTTTQLQTIVRSNPGLQSATVAITWSPDNLAGSTVNINVSLPVPVFVPLISTKSMTVASYSQMTIIQ
jgi:Flp pilus assembly protein TadG